MAAVTQTDSPPRGKRRWWLIVLVGSWIVLLTVLAVWSVGHEKSSVPEQRDIGLAVTDLQRAAGVVFAAATGPERAVVLGELEFMQDCRITPVRSGLVAARNVTVYVSEGGAVAAIDAIAAALPDDYEVDAGPSRGGTRVSMHADAGDFIGIDTNAPSATQTLTLRLTTGCRPSVGDGTPDGADPSTATPPLLGDVLTALGAQPADPAPQTVACPAGGPAGSYTVAGVPEPQNLATSLRTLSGGTAVIRTDADVRAFRSGTSSVIVAPDADRLRVTVTTACR